MNILQTIWTALTTPNEMLFKIISIPLNYLDIYVCMLFFSAILNIQSTKKQKLIYVFVGGTISTLVTFLVPNTYKVFLNIFIWPIMVFFILKTTILKSILSMIITLVATSILELIFANIFFALFNVTSEMIIEIPIYRLVIALSIYLVIFLLSKLINFFKVNIHDIDNLTSRAKTLIIINSLLIALVLAMQFYLITFYSSNMPLFVTIINIISLVAYFSVSIYSIVNSSKLETTKQDLESANLTIHSLTILHDQVRSFKHDFDNIVNSIGGYVINEDIDGLKKYYNQLLEECHKNK